MKRKPTLDRSIRRIKPLRGPQLVCLGEDNDPDPIVDILRRMGYAVYWNPGNEDINQIIVSDRRMTYGDCRRYYKRLNINLDWWKETVFVNQPNKELEWAWRPSA